MALFSWFELLRPRDRAGRIRQRHSRQQRTSASLAVEFLEDRNVPSFLAPADYAVGSAGAMLAADFNGDGRPDLAAAGDTSVSVLLGDGDGTFQAPKESLTGLGAWRVE